MDCKRCAALALRERAMKSFVKLDFFHLFLFVSIFHILQQSASGFVDLKVQSNISDNTSVRNDQSNTRPYAYLYAYLRFYFLKWYLPLVVGLGTFGTVFCLIFLFLSRLFPANMLIWLVSICVGDFLILVLEGIWMMLKVWFDYDIRDINHVSCVIHSSLSNYLLYWSAYMQTMLSMQRAYLIIRPIRARSSGPDMLSLIIIWCLISIILAIPMLPYPLYWRVIDGDCDPLENHMFYVTTVSDFVIWGLIPLICMTSATVIICWNIFRIRRSFRPTIILPNPTSTPYIGPSTNTYAGLSTKSISWNTFNMDRRLYTHRASLNNAQERFKKLFTEHALRADCSKHPTPQHSRHSETHSAEVHVPAPVNISPVQIGGQIPTKLHSNSITGGQQCQRHGPTDNAGHVTRLLICMNVWYMISTYPLVIYLMLLNFVLSNVDRDVHKFMYYLSRSLCFLNACSNWLFYCASGRLFRQRIRQIIRRFFQRIHLYSTSQGSWDVGAHMGRNPGVVSMLTPTHKPFVNAPGLRFTQSAKTSLDQPALQRIKLDLSLTADPNTHSLRERRLEGIIRWFKPMFKCHCFCVSPFRENNSDKVVKESTDRLEHREVCGHRWIACCTGYCCWRFWWYGLHGGQIDRDKVTTTQANLPIHSVTFSSTSSSSHFLSEVVRRNRSRDHSSINAPIRGGSCDRVLQSGDHGESVVRPMPTSESSKFIRHNLETTCFHSQPIHPTGSNLTREITRDPTSDSTVNQNCYCYIASLGNRKYQYHYCHLHRDHEKLIAASTARSTARDGGKGESSNGRYLTSPIYTVKSVDRLIPLRTDRKGQPCFRTAKFRHHSQFMLQYTPPHHRHRLVQHCHPTQPHDSRRPQQQQQQQHSETEFFSSTTTSKLPRSGQSTDIMR